jgi:hypothetical protein
MPEGAIDAITQTQAHIQQIGPFGVEAYGWISPQMQCTKMSQLLVILQCGRLIGKQVSIYTL